MYFERILISGNINKMFKTEINLSIGKLTKDHIITKQLYGSILKNFKIRENYNDRYLVKFLSIPHFFTLTQSPYMKNITLSLFIHKNEPF